ncbi:vesicle-fusing ATPase [Phtheirospermum japonicum]|uniref:Vesicle-fusing ATPase n=1 Tax=Phtheirospermum japonicum TaxID=374723 RepID=A0A830C5N1_9LAMI|nr:vesicle-fusing ATPase [Phtheirospermum japonicum]
MPIRNSRRRNNRQEEPLALLLYYVSLMRISIHHPLKPYKKVKPQLKGLPVIAIGVGRSMYDKASPSALKKFGRYVGTCIMILYMTGLNISALNQIKLLSVISTIDDLNYPEKTETYSKYEPHPLDGAPGNEAVGFSILMHCHAKVSTGDSVSVSRYDWFRFYGDDHVFPTCKPFLFPENSESSRFVPPEDFNLALLTLELELLKKGANDEQVDVVLLSQQISKRFMDQEIRLGDVDLIRALFERAISLSLPQNSSLQEYADNSSGASSSNVDFEENNAVLQHGSWQQVTSSLPKLSIPFSLARHLHSALPSLHRRSIHDGASSSAAITAADRCRRELVNFGGEGDALDKMRVLRFFYYNPKLGLHVIAIGVGRNTYNKASWQLHLAKARQSIWSAYDGVFTADLGNSVGGYDRRSCTSGVAASFLTIVAVVDASADDVDGSEVTGQEAIKSRMESGDGCCFC